MEKSFYQNVFLLTQAVPPPSKEFHKHFKEGMFDKPNTIGFLHVSHYLLTIYDAEYSKKVLKWPLLCKKDESDFRNNVKDFLRIVARDNPDVDFPQVLASHLLHASGSKFSTIMWNLSTVALRTYVKRETEFNLLVPKSGVAEDLSRMMLNNIVTKSAKNTEKINSRIIIEEQNAKTYASEIADSIKEIQEDIFVTRRNLMEMAPQAPVHPAMKNRLADPNDTEVVEIWKKSVADSFTYLTGKQKRLREVAELSDSVAGIIVNIASTDSNVLDGNSLPSIDTNALSEIDAISPETQIILHRLYENGVISLENLLELVSQFLSDYRRYLEKQGFPDLAGCDLQVHASCEDMKSMIQLFESLIERMRSISSKIKDVPKIENRFNVQNDLSMHDMDNDIFDSVLLKSSPQILINRNREPERADVDERLELTPVENMHNALFSRHKRMGGNATPNMLKPRDLPVFRINFDDTRPSCSSDKLMSPVNPSSRSMNQSMASRSGKYSRLFSSYPKQKRNRLNSSNAVVPGSWRNSTAVTDMSPVSNVFNVSELRPHLTITDSTFAENRATATQTMRTPTKRSANEGSSTINDKEESIATTLLLHTVIDESTELTTEVGRSPKVRPTEKSKDRNRRASISDLVERYKRVREKTIDVTSHLENSSDVSGDSGKH